MSRPPFVAFAALLALVSGAQAARAQGTLSTQGFGYPAGGLSTRAASTGGGFGEFDAQRLSRLVGTCDGSHEASAVMVGEYKCFGMGGKGNCGHQTGRQQRA